MEHAIILSAGDLAAIVFGVWIANRASRPVSVAVRHEAVLGPGFLEIGIAVVLFGWEVRAIDHWHRLASQVLDLNVRISVDRIEKIHGNGNEVGEVLPLETA